MLAVKIRREIKNVLKSMLRNSYSYQTILRQLNE